VVFNSNAATVGKNDLPRSLGNGAVCLVLHVADGVAVHGVVGWNSVGVPVMESIASQRDPFIYQDVGVKDTGFRGFHVKAVFAIIFRSAVFDGAGIRFLERDTVPFVLR